MRVLLALQKSVAQHLGRKVDVYYQEGYGAIVVHHNMPIHKRYVILVVSDEDIKIMQQTFKTF